MGADVPSVSALPSWHDYSSEVKSLATDGEVRLPTSCFRLFTGLWNLRDVDLSGFDSSDVTIMEGMFEWCSSLKTLSLSDWDTSKVVDMDGMFEQCSSLSSLDLS